LNNSDHPEETMNGLNIAEVQVAGTYAVEALGLPPDSLIVGAAWDGIRLTLRVIHESLPLVAEGEPYPQATVVLTRIESKYEVADYPKERNDG
jgi:hypothetical protein